MIRRRFVPAALAVAIAALLAVTALEPADSPGRPVPASATAETPGGSHHTPVTVATKFELAQACRRDLGVRVWQTSRDWETTTSPLYLDWLWRLWHKRHRECERQTDRALTDARYAIRLVFTGPGDPDYAGDAGDQAVRVAWCESRWTTRDQTGQYVGLFQLGIDERSAYGLPPYNSADPVEAASASIIVQVRSAYRMWIAAGRSWARWQCRPASGGETAYFLGW